jgi:hypothetical protein
LRCSFGYAGGKAPRDAEFRTGLEQELERLRTFLAGADAENEPSAD